MFRRREPTVAVFVRLITLPVAGNDWDLYDYPVDDISDVLSRSPLVRRDPRPSVLFTAVMAPRCLYYDSTGCW